VCITSRIRSGRGRAQPDEFATPGDWAVLIDHADAYLTPVWLTTGQHGPADLDCTAVQRLTLAIAAILAHDRQRGIDGGPITGTCVLSTDQQSTYTLQPPH